MTRGLVLLLLIVPVACAAPQGPAPAEERFAPPRSQAEAEARVRFLEERLDGGRRHAQIWQWSWTGLNAFGVAASTVGAVRTRNGDERAFNIVQVVQATIGLADLWWMRPMPGREGAEPMRDGDPATRLARGEQLLRETAQRSYERYDWKLHAGNLLLQLASAGVLLALDEPGYAALTFGTGMAGGEAFIWTQPWGPTRDVEDYRRLVASGLPPEPATTLRVVPTAGGIALRLEY